MIVPPVGDCITCQRRAPVSRKGQCHACWLDYSGWVPPEDLLAGPRVRTRHMIARALTEVGARWDFRPTDNRPVTRASGGAWDNYHPIPPRAGTPSWQIRPWQRYRWQVEDIWRTNDYGKRFRLPRRTDPKRLHPSMGHGVYLQCLVCLAPGEILRRDQVCDACEQNWRDWGRPWRSNDESWVTVRRVAQSDDLLAAYNSARCRFALSHRGSFDEKRPSTRYDRRPFSHLWYNGTGEFAKFQQAADPYPWRIRFALFRLFTYPEALMTPVVQATIIRGTADQVAAVLNGISGNRVSTARGLRGFRRDGERPAGAPVDRRISPI